MKHGFQAQVAYSYSKSLDDDSQSIAGDSFANAINSPWWFLPHFLHGPSDFDIRHTISINGLWDVPAPKFSNGFAKAALGGWELGSIVKINSGSPTTPIIGDDPLGLGNSGADQFGLLNKVPGCDPINHGFAGSAPGAPIWINDACYTLPQSTPAIAAQCQTFGATPTAAGIPGTCANLAGNVSRNSIYGPHLFNLDLSVLKNFPIKSISEAFNIQFRAEMFNITNHDNFVPPQPGSGDTNALLFGSDGKNNGPGVISALATEPREIQFALKFIW